MFPQIRLATLGLIMLVVCSLVTPSRCFFQSVPKPTTARRSVAEIRGLTVGSRAASPLHRSQLRMNIFEDAFKFFSNMNKEASAKHILMKGPDASAKLSIIKEELEAAEDLSTAFSEMAAKVSECPSANRGGNLGTFKPGMMVKEFDQVCFERELGVVHGPIETQFGSHLILITRRFEGDK